MIEEQIENLKNKVWTTYRIRIKSANRLLGNSRFLEFMSAYYSISLATLSVVGLIYEDKLFDIFNVLISIILLGIVYYASSINFKDRYISMKDNYLKIEKLYYDLITSEEKNNCKIINDVYSNYNQILNSVENHTSYDYLEFLKEEKDKGNEVDKLFFEKNKKILFLRNSAYYLLKFIVIIVPLLLFFYAVVNFFMA